MGCMSNLMMIGRKLQCSDRRVLWSQAEEVCGGLMRMQLNIE